MQKIIDKFAMFITIDVYVHNYKATISDQWKSRDTP